MIAAAAVGRAGSRVPDRPTRRGERGRQDTVIGKEAGYYTTRFANILLTPFLKDEISYKGAPVQLRGAYWDNVRTQMDAAAKRLERDGLLFGMPQKEPPPAPQKSSHILGDKASALGKTLKRLRGLGN